MMRANTGEYDENNSDAADATHTPAPSPTDALPFSMTNEEADIDAFRTYLAGITPEGLWDVRAHLDADRYPRRFEAVEREMRRRALFFVTPYTARELKIRGAALWGIGIAAFTALLRVIEIVDARLQAMGQFRIQLGPGEEVPLFVSLATGGARAARALLPIALPATGVVGLALFATAFYAIAQLRTSRIRRDVAGISVTGAVAVALLLWWAWRR